jgi:ankyrin repeat protein
MAVLNGHEAVVDALLSAGADVNVTTKHGQPLLLAVIRNQNKKVTKIIIKAGANLNKETRYSLYCSKRHKVSGDVLIAAIQWGEPP